MRTQLELNCNKNILENKVSDKETKDALDEEDIGVLLDRYKHQVGLSNVTKCSW